MAEKPVIVSFGWSGENREIKVVQKNGQWMTASFVDGKPDPMLVKLWGTHELPTPWPADVPRETVIQELAVRNTHAKVA